MDGCKTIIDPNKQKWLIEQVFITLGFTKTGTDIPFRMLDDLYNPNGRNIYGGEYFSCAFSNYYKANEEYYMGANKVRIMDDCDDDEEQGFILDEKDFYPYIEKYSMEYAKNNPEFKDRIFMCLTKIRGRFGIKY